MVGYGRFDRAALPHRFRVSSAQNHFGLGLLSPNHLFVIGAPRAGLHSLAMIFTLALVSKPKGLSASTTIKKECYTLKDCGDVVSKLKGMPGIITIKQIARKYSLQKYRKRV